MPKDNEIIHLPLDGPVKPSEPLGFAPEEMIRCEECLRANPPTRFACLYCEAPLPASESTAHLRKLTLKQPEKYQPGFNCILVHNPDLVPHKDSIEKAAELLKLAPETVERIVALQMPMPLARTAKREEALLVNERLRDLGFSTVILSDEDLGRPDHAVIRIRSLQFEESHLRLYQAGGKKEFDVAWSGLYLVVSGRLVVQSVELLERVSRRAENEILDTSQFFFDEQVLDLYSSLNEETWRIGTTSFDFSCLQEQKSLIAVENLKKLHDLILSKRPGLQLDTTYDELKSILQPMWPSEQETHSRGWKRERPGKYSLGAVTANSNESQFTRYSRLRRHFATK